MIHLLQKSEDVSTLAAAKAVIKTHLGAHVKTRAAFLVKRTQALHRTRTGALQSDIVADDIRQIGARTHLVDIATFNQACHSVDSKVVSP